MRWLAVLSLAFLCAAEEELYGPGLCGITQTFMKFQGRMTSNQRSPAWVQTDNPPALAFVSVDVMFRPSYFTITLQAPDDPHLNVSCEFECAISKPVNNYPDVMLIAVNSSRLIGGNSSAFGCLSTDDTATGDSTQMVQSLMLANCGNGSRIGLNGSNYFELQYERYYHSTTSPPESNWLRNLTFQSLSGADFNTYNVTNPAYSNMTFTNIPWMTCPCGISCDYSTAILDVTLSLRAYPDVEWGLPTPLYLRDGFLFTMMLVVLFGTGWVALFVAAWRPKWLREEDDYSESSDDGSEEEEEEDSGDDAEAASANRRSGARRQTSSQDDDDDESDDDGESGEGMSERKASDDDDDEEEIPAQTRPLIPARA